MSDPLSFDRLRLRTRVREPSSRCSDGSRPLALAAAIGPGLSWTVASEVEDSLDLSHSTSSYPWFPCRSGRLGEVRDALLGMASWLAGAVGADEAGRGIAVDVAGLLTGGAGSAIEGVACSGRWGPTFAGVP